MGTSIQVAITATVMAILSEGIEAQSTPGQVDAISIGVCVVEERVEEGVPFWVAVPVSGANAQRLSLEFELRQGDTWVSHHKVAEPLPSVVGSESAIARRLERNLRNASIEMLVDYHKVMWTPGRWRVQCQARTMVGAPVIRDGPWTEFSVNAEPWTRALIERALRTSIGSTQQQGVEALAVKAVYERAWQLRAEPWGQRLMGKDPTAVLASMEALANGSAGSGRWRAYCRLRLANLWRGEAMVPAEMAPNRPPRHQLGIRVVAAADNATDLGAMWSVAREWERLMGLALSEGLTGPAVEQLLQRNLDARWGAGNENWLKEQLPPAAGNIGR